MAEIWLISDTHFGHKNIIEYCNRPFSSVTEMDWEMVEEWNKEVKPGDHVYHLGDVYMGCSRGYIDNLLSKLNGQKRLILGNHDAGKDQTILKYFEKIYAMRFFSEFGLQLTHMPLHPSSVKEDYQNVHGHIHDKEIADARYRCVCVEHTNYTPINIEEVRIK